MSITSVCRDCNSTSSLIYIFFFFKQKTAYEMRISDWSSDVCSSDLDTPGNELSYITNLPSMAVTALYHGKATAASPEALPKKRGNGRRSEERRVGKECVSTCRSRWSPYH